jgi:hypothetical protein
MLVGGSPSNANGGDVERDPAVLKSVFANLHLRKIHLICDRDAMGELD